MFAPPVCLRLYPPCRTVSWFNAPTAFFFPVDGPSPFLRGVIAGYINCFALPEFLSLI